MNKSINTIHKSFYKGYEYRLIVDEFFRDTVFFSNYFFSVLISVKHPIYNNWNSFTRESFFRRQSYELSESCSLLRDELEVAFYKKNHSIFAHCSDLKRMEFPSFMTGRRYEVHLNNTLEDAKKMIDLLYLLENRSEFYK